jgi:hypothetical protein
MCNFPKSPTALGVPVKSYFVTPGAVALPSVESVHLVLYP